MHHSTRGNHTCTQREHDTWIPPRGRDEQARSSDTRSTQEEGDLIGDAVTRTPCFLMKLMTACEFISVQYAGAIIEQASTVLLMIYGVSEFWIAKIEDHCELLLLLWPWSQDHGLMTGRSKWQLRVDPSRLGNRGKVKGLCSHFMLPSMFHDPSWLLPPSKKKTNPGFPCQRLTVRLIWNFFIISIFIVVRW
jgi:hypothetical protein